MAAARGVVVLGLLYAVVTCLGLLSLREPGDPIGDPYFTTMELLIVLTAPLMVIVMVALHAFAPRESRGYSLVALAFMVIMAGITCSVHVVVLTVGRRLESLGVPAAQFLFSFKWPSAAYALDIVAWDFFFALSMLFAAPVFSEGRLQRAVRTLMIASGLLSLAGLIGVPLENMQVRLIGVFGYAALPPIAFLMVSLVFKRTVESVTPVE
ncbi:MAG TPA: hypothetical protein VHI13_12675 [Candidatus Kapabacteria bacterium]|nr:hypothetical protein [Candidatus Kapabacteria bacterium]